MVQGSGFRFLLMITTKVIDLFSFIYKKFLPTCFKLKTFQIFLYDCVTNEVFKLQMYYILPL